ncbi:histidine kinase [Nocardia sp. NBC_01503]|uniref:sensor histidine kinase n=1 Tax=Nocardia sp. NBC_01503 TaxID=2975997 RepID=UPI002E7C5241|nr:histidine kinase [Nocardia sp. NBC_01503]WTL30447.1 histidine kinase [Nocardia sp. NBC_01503]
MLIGTPPTGLTRLFRLGGLVVVIVTSWHAPEIHQPWVLIAALVSWIGWAGWVVAPAAARSERIFLCAMAIGGGFTAMQLTGSMMTALVVIVFAIAVLSDPVWFGLTVAGVTAVAMCLSGVLAGSAPTGFLGIVTSAGLVALMGWNRRQTRVAAEQNRLLLEQSRVIRVERDRAAALAERGRIARDIHDVLAHTLGGLVLQLDAADALLEAGAVDKAAERVKASHALAVSGLADARRVVGTLRSEEFDLAAELHRLTAEHRAAGGAVDLSTEAHSLEMNPEVRAAPTVTGGRAVEHPVSEQVAVALARAVQEALTNARKHAPGQPVTLIRHDGAADIEITISNHVVAHMGSLARSGAGAGLLGMRERIAAVGGTVTAGKEDGRWMVRIRVPRR